jgi:predicted Zn-dependent protease
MGADPLNATLREQVIAELVNSGKPEIAIPIVKQLMADNPGDPAYGRTYWLVLRASRNWKEAIPAGVAYVTMDSSAADTTYFLRQINDAATDSAFAKAAEFASQAAAKWPQRTDFLLLKGQNERKAGQLQAAKATFERVLQLDPKTPLVAAQLATIASDAGNFEDAVKYLQSDVAADASNKSRDGALALNFAQKAYQAAAASKKPDDFKRALGVAQAADAIDPSNTAKFFVAVSAFQWVSVVANETLTPEAKNAKPTADEKAKSCEDFKATNDMLALVSPAIMGGGGKQDPNTAAQLMQGIPQIQAFLDGNIKRVCGK